MPATQTPPLKEIQRARLLAGAVSAIDELGYADATVGHITRRAGVSRRTFYELFAGREECLTAVLEDAMGAIAAELAASGLEHLPWRERIRGGLAAILAFLDREPALARACVVQALRGGPRVLARREEILAGLASAVDEGRAESARGAGCSPLTAEGLVGAAFGIVYARLLRGEREPLFGLLGELVGMVVLPYLGPAAARREQVRPASVPEVESSRRWETRLTGEPSRGVPVRLTYRTVRVLGGVAELGERGSAASNRAIAAYAGIVDQGQVSKLLRRLEHAGLLANTGHGHTRGEPNAWVLTPQGEALVRSISTVASRVREAA
jgi:AcrR family transcriptional regulator